MKRLSVKREALIAVALALVTVAAVAGEKKVTAIDPDLAAKAATVKGTMENGDKTDTFASQMAAYKADRDTLVTRLAAYDADQVTATNKIAQADTVAKAKTAMEKMQDEIEDLARCIKTLNQITADLKRAQVAAQRGR